MFLLSGVIFLIVGARAGDILTILGALVWMVGCGAFFLGNDESR